MNIIRAINHQNKMISRINYCYDMAEIMGYSSSQLTDNINNQIFDYLRACRAPQWLISYLSGYEKCLHDNLYRDKLVFGVFLNGEFYSTHSDREDYYVKKGIDPCQFNIDMHENSKYVGHYWKKNLKPYFVQ